MSPYNWHKGKSPLLCPCTYPVDQLQGGGIPLCSRGWWPKVQAGLWCQCVTLCGSMPVGSDCLPRTENTFLRATARKSGANVQQLWMRRGERAWIFLFHWWAEGGVIQDAFLVLFWTLRKLSFSSSFIYLLIFGCRIGTPGRAGFSQPYPRSCWVKIM